jgi:chromosome segregation ATPase
MLLSMAKLGPGDNRLDVEEQENRAISAAAARDRETMEGHIQTLSAQVRDLQECLSDTATRLDDAERSVRSWEKRAEERFATIEDLEKRLKAANAKQHELVHELAASNAELNKVKDASYEAAKKKDETISKSKDALEKERLRADEVFPSHACAYSHAECR